MLVINLAQSLRNFSTEIAFLQRNSLRILLNSYCQKGIKKGNKDKIDIKKNSQIKSII